MPKVSLYWAEDGEYVAERFQAHEPTINNEVVVDVSDEMFYRWARIASDYRHMQDELHVLYEQIKSA